MEIKNGRIPPARRPLWTAVRRRASSTPRASPWRTTTRHPARPTSSGAAPITRTQRSSTRPTTRRSPRPATSAAAARRGDSASCSARAATNGASGEECSWKAANPSRRSGSADGRRRSPLHHVRPHRLRAESHQGGRGARAAAALVVQGTRHRPTESAIQVRVLARAL